MSHIVAIIPARSGSKSVKDKNIRLMNGKPLIAHSIEQALASKLIDRVIVSTDSLQYQAIALEYGAEVPFLRPKEISTDSSLDIEVFEHALKWLRDDGYYVNICVHLRPTHPVRDPADIDRMIEIMRNDHSLDAVRSISPAVQTPYKMWLFSDDGSEKILPVASCSVPEAYNAPRQSLPVAYMQNACIDVIRADCILEKHSMTGTSIAGYKMAYNYDIDTEADFSRAERAQMLLESLRKNRPLKIVCDIDGVIALKTPNNDYSMAMPHVKNIDILKALYEKGHQIILFTARGYKTGKDWKDTTRTQMHEWGVPYHELIFGKPDADVYIDDRLIELDDLKLLLKG